MEAPSSQDKLKPTEKPGIRTTPVTLDPSGITPELRVSATPMEDLERLVFRYRNPLFAHAMKVLRNQDDAQDAVQDTLLKAIRALPKFEPGRALEPWLHLTCTNSCIDVARRRKRDPLHFTPGVQDSLSISDPHYSSIEIECQWEAALNALPELDRRLLVLRHLEGHPISEIADSLKTPEGTVKSWLFRARRKMRLSLGHPL